MEPFNSFASTNKDQIIFTKRQVSMMMASMIFCCLIVFIVGFFLGKRVAIDDFSLKLTQESLHDQIDFLLTNQSLQSSNDIDTVQIDEHLDFQDHKIDESTLGQENDRTQSHLVDQNNEIPAELPLVNSLKAQNEHEVDIKSKESPQYACLIGFGTKKAAQLFVSRLKKHNISVILKTIISKTASGKQKTWYQAITPTYASAEQLQEAIVKIQRFEHIRDKDIKIVYTKPRS